MKEEKYLQDFYESVIRNDDRMPRFDELKQADVEVLVKSASYALFKLQKEVSRVKELLVKG